MELPSRLRERSALPPYLLLLQSTSRMPVLRDAILGLRDVLPPQSRYQNPPGENSTCALKLLAQEHECQRRRTSIANPATFDTASLRHDFVAVIVTVV